MWVEIHKYDIQTGSIVSEYSLAFNHVPLEKLEHQSSLQLMKEVTLKKYVMLLVNQSHLGLSGNIDFSILL